MLLETLDIKTNDIVIFSQNHFDQDNNFKIIFKDDPELKIRKIEYSEVCKFVNEYTPKNLIVYRLLTNIRNFEINLTKYGFPICINSVFEVMYFDPVFALNDLQEYRGSILQELRFRIQQVGLTTLTRKGNSPNFAEIYNVDLQAIEAKYQNDRVFADAIFAKNPAYKAVVNPQKAAAHIEENKKVKNTDVSEDDNFDYRQIRRMNVVEGSARHEGSAFSEFLHHKKAVPDYFPAAVQKQIIEREDQKVVLKIKKI